MGWPAVSYMDGFRLGRRSLIRTKPQGNESGCPQGADNRSWAVKMSNGKCLTVPNQVGDRHGSEQQSWFTYGSLCRRWLWLLSPLLLLLPRSWEESAQNVQETCVHSCWEDPREKGTMTPTLELLPGEESHGQKRLVGYSSWGHSKDQTQLTFNFTFFLNCC